VLGVASLPQTLNPYVYAVNNPVNLTDPSGEIVPLLLLGAAIGGGFAAFNYFQTQPCATFSSALQDPGFLRAVLVGAGVGAITGLVGGGMAAAWGGAFGGGLLGSVMVGAASGGVASGLGEALTQVGLYGKVRNPQLIGAAMLSGVASGGVLGGVGYGIGKLLPSRNTTYTGRAYRSASGTPDSVTPRPGIDDVSGGGLSFFDSLDNPGVKSGKYVEIDTSRLRALIAIRDNQPPGHITIRPPTLTELRAWAATRGTGKIHPFTQEVLDAIVIGKKP